MKHNLQKWPQCDKIFRDFFGFGARKPSDEAARGMGRKWGGKKLDSARGFANKSKDRIAMQFFFNKINYFVGKRQGELALTKA